MKIQKTCWSLLCLGAVFSLTAVSPASAQSVQQPVFQAFSTNTTVTVPDGGSALLGGVDSARFGTSSRGVPMLGKIPGIAPLFNNRARGSELTSSRNHVRVRIIDLREMDEALLGTGASGLSPPIGRGAAVDLGPADNAARFLTKHVGRRPGADRNRAKPVSSDATPASRARLLLARGDAALADGKIELATRYYREAERVAKEPTPPAATRVAQRRRSAADPAIVLGE